MSLSDEREWDRLSEIETALPAELESPGDGGVSSSVIVAAGLADLVLVLALTTALVLALSVQSLPFRPSVLYWALPVAMLWWLMAVVICLRVLKASPGMVIAGLSFVSELQGSRLVLTLLTLLAGAALLGLPLSIGGARSSLLSRAAGLPLVRRAFV